MIFNDWFFYSNAALLEGSGRANMTKEHWQELMNQLNAFTNDWITYACKCLNIVNKRYNNNCLNNFLILNIELQVF